MKKWNNLQLAAVLILLVSCKTEVTDLRVEKSLLLNDFPSGSSLEYYQDGIYLTSDDATKLLVFDTAYNRVDSIVLFHSKQTRIAKAEKTDLECSALIKVNNRPNLLLIGSASQPAREKIILISLNDITNLRVQSTAAYFKRLQITGITEVNIEGATTAGSLLIMSNRGNLSHPGNHLVFTGTDFWLHQQTAGNNTAAVTLPVTKTFAGISGLAYIEREDLLLFTASTELTGNSIEDGQIGDSYIGWIKNISRLGGWKEIPADGLINLGDENTVFAKEKIESICVSHSEGNTHTIHLVSDNDNGVSRLFQVRLTIN